MPFRVIFWNVSLSFIDMIWHIYGYVFDRYTWVSYTREDLPVLRTAY